MIKIYRDDTGDEIQFEGDILFTLKNPMFNEASSHSFTITSKNTRHNRNVFDYAFLPEVRDNRIVYNITANFYNTLFLKGGLYLTNHTSEILEYSFLGQNNFNYYSERKNMRDLTIPWIGQYLPYYNYKAFDNFPIVNEYNNRINSNPVIDTRSTTIPVFNLNELLVSVLNDYGLSVKKNDIATDQDLNKIYFATDNSNANFILNIGSASYSGRASGTVSNNYYNIYDIGHGLTDEQIIYFYRIVFSEKPPYDHGTIPEQFDVTNHPLYKVKTRIKVVDADNFRLTDLTPSEYGAINETDYWNVAYYHLCSIVYDGVLSENNRDHLPDMMENEFKNECEILTASKIIINESEKSCRILSLKNIINATEYLDITRHAGIKKGYRKYPKDGYKLSWSLSDSDSFYSDQVSEIDTDRIKSSVNIYNNLPLTGNKAGDIRLVTLENKYYIWNELPYIGLGKWEFKTENFLNKESGNKEFTIESKFVPMSNYLYGGAVTQTQACRMDSETSFLCLGNVRKSVIRSFLYLPYGAIFSSQRGRLFQFNTDGTNPIYLSNLDLDWNGNNGLYERYYKEWVDFMVNNYGEEERVVNWPLELLQSFDWALKYRINNMNYYVKEIMFKANAKTVEMGKSVLIPAIH